MRLREVAGWALLPALLVMQFFDLRRGLVGEDWTWSAFLFGYAAIVLVGLPLAWPDLKELPRPTRVGLAAFTVLLVWAFVSVLVSGESPVTSRTTAEVVPPDTWTGPPLRHRLVPLLTAWLTMAAGVVSVLLVPAVRRLSTLWWAAWLLVVTSLVAWPRAVLVHDSPRLATGMGGSATIHLVFLLCVGLFLGAAWQGHRPRWSLVGAAAAAGCLLLTGSRSGLLSLAVLVVLVLVWLGRRLSIRLAAAALAGVVLVGAAVIAFVPAARHLVVFGDELRGTNLATAWRVFTSDPVTTVFGFGSGRLWPWYAFDARYWAVPWRGQVHTSVGDVLTNPHSVLLGVGVELGIVGLLLLGVLVAVLLVRLVQGWRQRSDQGFGSFADGLTLALVAGLVAWTFDFYLFKNFAVSYWWWACFTAVFVVAPARRPHPAPEPPQ
ncbi:O-antigen ligase family protein [Propionibacteriaceae bacterium Y1923]|uniref:O-antigen ligase family protein n=1 Tax=Aestuariimicrobium sp. Y1814 TaxID=3418742 RepID=UPI003C28A645